MAHKKAGGSTRLGRDSQAKRLGIKRFAGEFVLAGSIILRQRGTKYLPGKNVGLGKDATLYAVKDGRVSFSKRLKRSFSGKKALKTVVEIKPS